MLYKALDLALAARDWLVKHCFVTVVTWDHGFYDTYVAVFLTLNGALRYASMMPHHYGVCVSRGNTRYVDMDSGFGCDAGRDRLRCR